MSKRTLSLALFVVFIGLCRAASANHVITADYQFQRYMLDGGEDSVVGYLKNGIPSRSTATIFERWELYGFVADKAGELKSAKAVPALIDLIEKPLPSQIQTDLQYFVVARARDSWEDWDRQYFIEMMGLRSRCAMALAQIGDEKALPVLTAYLKSVTPGIEAVLKSRDPESAPMLYGILCKAITALGSKDGVDALIARLDLLPKTPDALVYYARICTGQTFGPEYDQPTHTRPAEIAKWKAWWKQNRDTYQIDRERILTTQKPDLPRPVPQTVRDHVRAAETRYMDHEGTGYGTASEEWLKANGQQHVDELAEIVNDNDELARVRGEALAWYARFGGEKALALLTELATDDSRYEGTEAFVPHLQTPALKLIEENFPDRVDEVARKCLFSKNMVSGNAAIVLIKNKDNWQFLADNFGKFSSTGRFHAIQALVNLDDPVGRNAFFEAVRDEDPYMAYHGAEGIEKFNLGEQMPKETANALAKWNEDPGFLLIKASDGPQRGQAELAKRAVERITTTDAEAASLYHRAWFFLPEDQKGAVVSDIDRCIAAYKARNTGKGR